MNKNLIAFKKGFVTADLGNAKIKDTNVLLDIQHFMMSYGFMLSKDAYSKLSHTSVSFLRNLKLDLSKYFRDMFGDENAKELKELFNQFVETPEQRELRLANEKQDLRLKKYAIIYSDEIYTSMLSYCNLIWDSKQVEKDVPQVYETTKFKIINFVDEDGFKDIFTKLVKLGTALTKSDFEIVEWFVKEYGNDNKMPNSIPFKENLCMLASLGIDVPVKTTTDVLRIATYMSNGTTDLYLPKKMILVNSWKKEYSENPKRKEYHFKKFKRSERRYLLSLLERVVDVKEMVLKRNRWIKLGEILHSGEYSNQFPLAAKAFNLLRNTKVKSWYSELNKAFSKSLEDGLKKLSERPGEYARRLDSLIRNNTSDVNLILDNFVKNSDKLSSKVLWELYSHFESRNDEVARSVWIKGARKPTILPNLDSLDVKIIDSVQSIILKMLSERYSRLESLGNVYIDEELKKIPVPTNMRTLQESTKVVVRGTRMPLDTSKKVLRPYIHWTAGVDLDLSISFVDGNGKTTICSYTNLSPHSSVQHSGDVIPRVVGKWAEYIDIEMDKVPYKYGLLTVRNFSGNSLENVGAVIGFMERDTLQSSKKWYPKTIETSFKVSSEGSNVNLLIIDFETKEWILIDEDVAGIPKEFGGNIVKYIERLSQNPKLSVYDVLDMHVNARGNKVENDEEADINFTFDDFSTSYEKIAEYML